MNILSYNLYESLVQARKLGVGIDSAVFDELMECDTTRTYKYLLDIIRFYKAGATVASIRIGIAEFADKAQRGLLTVDQLKSYATVDELLDAVARVAQSGKQKRRTMKNGGLLVHEDAKAKVVKITTVEASQMYGYGTKWCISGDSAENYWDDYVDKMGGVFYFVFIKDKVLAKELQEAYYNDVLQYYDGEVEDDYGDAIGEDEITALDNFTKFAVGCLPDGRISISMAFDVVCSPNHKFFHLTGLDEEMFVCE